MDDATGEYAFGARPTRRGTAVSAAGRQQAHRDELVEVERGELARDADGLGRRFAGHRRPGRTDCLVQAASHVIGQCRDCLDLGEIDHEATI